MINAVWRNLFASWILRVVKHILFRTERVIQKGAIEFLVKV